jgi:hypothetical protein
VVWEMICIINYKFSIGEKVRIKELDWPGTVISLWSGRRGNEIQVRYCWNGKFEEVYFFEYELEEIVSKVNGAGGGINI